MTSLAAVIASIEGTSPPVPPLPSCHDHGPVLPLQFMSHVVTVPLGPCWGTCRGVEAAQNLVFVVPAAPAVAIAAVAGSGRAAASPTQWDNVVQVTHCRRHWRTSGRAPCAVVDRKGNGSTPSPCCVQLVRYIAGTGQLFDGIPWAAFRVVLSQLFYEASTGCRAALHARKGRGWRRHH